MLKLFILLLSLSAYPMKVIIVDGKAFATHADDQAIDPQVLYPTSTAMLIADDGLPYLGTQEVRDAEGNITTPAKPPMSEAAILATMKEEQKAKSYLNYDINTMKAHEDFEDAQTVDAIRNYCLFVYNSGCQTLTSANKQKVRDTSKLIYGVVKASVLIKLGL